LGVAASGRRNREPSCPAYPARRPMKRRGNTQAWPHADSAADIPSTPQTHALHTFRISACRKRRGPSRPAPPRRHLSSNTRSRRPCSNAKSTLSMSLGPIWW